MCLLLGLIQELALAHGAQKIAYFASLFSGSAAAAKGFSFSTQSPFAITVLRNCIACSKNINQTILRKIGIDLEKNGKTVSTAPTVNINFLWSNL